MQNELTSLKTFRYETLNNETCGTTVIYVLHGYGQLAKFFIRKFQDLPNNVLIVAPEGMHRFYKKGNSGRVGASWMTKECRETDIQDNLNWLTELDQKLTSEFRIKKRILLGFSQGGATAVRWKWNQQVKFDATFIWASDFPPDIENKKLFGQEESNHFVVGTEDEFFDASVQDQMIEFYKSIGFKISTYLGSHDIDQDVLNNLFKTITE